MIQGKKISEELAATRIQALFRGYQARTKFGITQLNGAELMDYEALVIGNDPIINGLDNYAIKEDNFALIATSGLRAVLIACRLTGNNKQHIPKIVLVDNSRQVYELWRLMRGFLSSCDANDKCDFLSRLPDFLAQHSYLYREFAPHSRQYPSQDIAMYFNYLFDHFDYGFVRNIILNTTYIKQSWADNHTFANIKHTLDYLGIKTVVAYPSNIISCYSLEKDSAVIESILKNMTMLHSSLSIYTDLCSRHQRPEHVFLLQDQNEDRVRDLLFPGGNPVSCESENSNRFFSKTVDKKAERAEVVSADIRHYRQ